ncbi:MAG: hypothetical protein IJ343_13410 [Clostridia bacterium]|nr:hypothetical protein [Clostridia bacterium]
MQKKLLLLGGFPQMIPIVETARRMGLWTIVVDMNEASPAKAHADEAIHMSTHRIDDLEALCREKGVAGVFNGFEDFNIHIACELCRRLELPFYSSREQLAQATDKRAFKEVCRRYGVLVTAQYTLPQALQEARYPYIVKPADSYGSRGVSVCRDAQELQAGVRRAEETSRTGSSLIERFVDRDHGTELFYTIVNDSIHLTATADRYTVRPDGMSVPLPVAEVFPSRHRDDMLRKLDGPVRRMLAGMGLRNGLVLIQALWDEGPEGDEYLVYEMAHRFTGEQHHLLVREQQGIRLDEMMIRFALGEDIAAYDTPLLDDTAFVRPGINLAIPLRPGRIAGISGVEQVRATPGVLSCDQIHTAGDEIGGQADYNHMLLRVNLTAPDQQTLRETTAGIVSCVSVTSSDGGDMLLTRFSLPEKA